MTEEHANAIRMAKSSPRGRNTTAELATFKGERGALKHPPSQSSRARSPRFASTSPTRRPKKRNASVYDAVAGRVTTSGFLTSFSHTQPSSLHRDTLSHSHIPLPAGEVLFKQARAPDRFEEDDIYTAHRHLDAKQRLPASDLLKAIHTYATEFYGKATGDRGRCDWRSLDETALLAVGMLVEEELVRCLGEAGDLVFVEGEEFRGSRTSGVGEGGIIGRGCAEKEAKMKARRSKRTKRRREEIGVEGKDEDY